MFFPDFRSYFRVEQLNQKIDTAFQKILTADNLQKKRMASSRSLCVVRWAAGIKTTSISALLICQSGVESNLAWEHFDVQMIHFTQDPVHFSACGKRPHPRSQKKKEDGSTVW